MTDKEYAGLSVGDTVEFRPGVQEVSHKVQLNKVFFFNVRTIYSIYLQKEEIARQFMLPERKSKIATLLKQDGQAYCICRSSDSSRFMM